MTVNASREKSVITVRQNGKLQAVTADRLWTVHDVSPFLGVPVGTLSQWRYMRVGRLVRNVAEGVPLPRVVGKPKRFLTHDQVQALAEACARYGTLIKVLAYTGLRWGELVALTAHCVDLKRRRIEVVEAITEVHGRVIVGTTKPTSDAQCRSRASWPTNWRPN